MSDILQEAEEMMTHPNGYAPSLITQIVGGLVAEIKRLRDERHAILGVKTKEGLTASEWVLRTGLAKRQLAAKDALINQLRDRCWKAEQEVSQLQASKTGIMLTYDPTGPVTFNGIEYVPREEALAEPHDGDLTAAYVLGSQKANERLKVLQGYVTRLEAAYIDMVFSATGSDKEAQVALDKIREGT